MDNKQHKIFTTVIVVVIMFLGVALALRLQEATLPYLTISLLLANSTMMLILISLLHQFNSEIKAKIEEQNTKKKK